jgi:hypothetical protein
MMLMDGKKEKQKRKTVKTDGKRKTNKIRKKNEARFGLQSDGKRNLYLYLGKISHPL